RARPRPRSASARARSGPGSRARSRACGRRCPTMPELERELGALAGTLDFPPTPDVASQIHARMPNRVRSRRKALSLALAAVFVAVGAALAVPQARTAVLRFLDIGNERIEFVDHLPKISPTAPLHLGTEIDADNAPFPLLRSKLLGEPDGVYARNGVITQLYGSPKHVRLLITEIAGVPFNPSIGKKIAAAGTRVQFLPINGATGPAVWIEGRPHIL